MTPINSAMIFDEGGSKTAFARCDERAIKHHVDRALKIISRWNTEDRMEMNALLQNLLI